MNETDITCVIDMQYPFLGTDDHAQIQAVIELVAEARKRGETILLIEDTHGHTTDERIRAATAGYDNTHVVRKSQWSGALEILDKCRQLNVRPSSFKACGAYDSQCVMATVSHLREHCPFTPLTVFRAACVPAPTTRMRDKDWDMAARRLELVVA